MASVLNRTTLEYRTSVNTPDFSTEDWVIDPDLSAVRGVPVRYWKLVNDELAEMTSEEKATVDATTLAAQREATIAQLDQIEDVGRAFMLLVLDELNAHALKINAILDAVDAATTLANLKTAVGAIADYPARSESQLKTAIKAKLGT